MYCFQRWRKVWCVLVAEGRRSVARLELYEHKHSSFKQGSTKRKPDYKQVIRLRECIRISNCNMADCPKDCAAFLLETSDKLYVFAGLQSEVKDWISSLCQQAFPVGSVTSNHCITIMMMSVLLIAHNRCIQIQMSYSRCFFFVRMWRLSKDHREKDASVLKLQALHVSEKCRTTRSMIQRRTVR